MTDLYIKKLHDSFNNERKEYNWEISQLNEKANKYKSKAISYQKEYLNLIAENNNLNTDLELLKAVKKEQTTVEKKDLEKLMVDLDYYKKRNNFLESKVTEMEDKESCQF